MCTPDVLGASINSPIVNSSMRQLHLLHEASHPILLVHLPTNGEVVSCDDFREKAVNRVPLFHDGHEGLALLVIPQRRRLLRKHLLQMVGKMWHNG